MLKLFGLTCAYLLSPDKGSYYVASTGHICEKKIADDDIYLQSF